MAVSRISLQNFKFFRQREELTLNGNHLLIYGENGSGKSSIYWALYTLLECANKPDNASIDKYFDSSNDACITNIFLVPGQPDFIESEVLLELDDGSTFCLSSTNRTVQGNLDAQASNYASEFLNYKTLFRIHDFVHSNEIDLFPYFEKEVLPYVKFSPITHRVKRTDGSLEERQTENANEIWNLVKNGISKSSLNTNGDPKYPSKKEQDFIDYNAIVNGFKSEMESLLTYINTEGNPILQTDFEGDFIYKLEFVEIQPFKITAQKFTPPTFLIKLTVPSFHGSSPVPRPQSFLNEARLSALGLSIRFAVLKKRLQTAKLRLALLDDFMISLDMNNRDVALDYVLDKVVPHYQTIILTHDNYFYEMVKDKIRRKKLSNWKTYKMFETHDDERDPLNSKPKPFITEDKGKVNKAWGLFRSKDYASSANMLRQATEKLCNAYLTRKEMLDSNYGMLNLNLRINKLIAKGVTEGIDSALLFDLSKYKDRLMDHGSHHNIEGPLFKNELRKAIETLEKLKSATGNPDL